jgi:hypothetical protein
MEGTQCTIPGYSQYKNWLEEIFRSSGNNNIIFISPIYRKEAGSTNAIEPYKPENCHISKHDELSFQISIDGRELNIPYSAIKKVWIDVNKNVNFELDLIIFDDRTDVIKLEPIIELPRFINIPVTNIGRCE